MRSPLAVKHTSIRCRLMAPHCRPWMCSKTMAWLTRPAVINCNYSRPFIADCPSPSVSYTSRYSVGSVWYCLCYYFRPGDQTLPEEEGAQMRQSRSRCNKAPTQQSTRPQKQQTRTTNASTKWTFRRAGGLEWYTDEDTEQRRAAAACTRTRLSQERPRRTNE